MSNVIAASPCMGPGLGRNVLLVEEQMALMLLAEDVLAREGYRVATAGSFHAATRAMAACMVEAAIVDLDLTDHSSMLLADELIELGIPLAFASTGAQQSLPKRFHRTRVLQKPYLPEALLAAVASLLNQPGRAAALHQVPLHPA